MYDQHWRTIETRNTHPNTRKERREAMTSPLPEENVTPTVAPTVLPVSGIECGFTANWPVPRSVVATPGTLAVIQRLLALDVEGYGVEVESFETETFGPEAVPGLPADWVLVQFYITARERQPITSYVPMPGSIGADDGPVTHPQILDSESEAAFTAWAVRTADLSPADLADHVFPRGQS